MEYLLLDLKCTNTPDIIYKFTIIFLFPSICVVTCEELDGVMIGEQCLYFSTPDDGQVSWSGAISACERKGGVLASPHDPRAIRDYLAADQGHSYITGNNRTQHYCLTLTHNVES